MRRREFIAGLGSAAAWPLAARAQQPAMPVVGYLSVGSPETSANFVAAFRNGLSETGYVDGRNVAIEFRWTQYDNDRLSELAADLVRRGVSVIVTPQSTPAALAAKALTTTIPIVFSGGADPVQNGLVASLNRPGGNVTGVNSMNVELGQKRLELLHELTPGAASIAVLANPNSPLTEPFVTDVRMAASAIGWQIEVLSASTNRDIDAAFANLPQKRMDTLLVSPDPLFENRRVQLATLAIRHAIPAIYSDRVVVEVG